MSGDTKPFTILLRPDRLVVVILDHQAELVARLPSAYRAELRSNTLALAKIAAACGVPILFSNLQCAPIGGRPAGYLIDHCRPEAEVLRSRLNCWEDRSFAERIEDMQVDRLLLAGLFTEASVSLAALSALELGYEPFLVADAAAASSPQAHRAAVQRMVQAGVVPTTVRQLLFELYECSGGHVGPLAPAVAELMT